MPLNRKWHKNKDGFQIFDKFYFKELTTVELRSKGPGRKGNPPLREMISGLIGHSPINFYIGYKGISVNGKD